MTFEIASIMIEAMKVEPSSDPEVGADHRARALAALADPIRLQILDALVLGDISSGELCAQLGLASNLLAHHIGVLEREGLVDRHRSQADRRRSYVRLVPGAFDGLLPGLSTTPRSATTVPAVTRVVFVCTANSARSQLAAALWSQHSSVPVSSGGTHPAPGIAPGAAAVAERHQLALVQRAPQPLPALTAEDYLVTVCDNAYEDLIHDNALATTRPHRAHWSVPDPVPVGNNQAFEDAYAELEGRVVTLARHLKPATDARTDPESDREPA